MMFNAVRKRLTPVGHRPAKTTFSLSVLFVACMLSFFGWLGATGADLRHQIRVETKRAVRMAELRGTISYLNEWLTMSARLAALTGEQRWVDRYNEVGPQLGAAIDEAVRLATPEVSKALRSTTDEANGDLVKMERAALALAASGDREQATALLDSSDFDYLQQTYDTGLEAFGQDLLTLAADRTTRLNDRAWTETVGLAISAIFVVATGLALLTRSRLRAARARADAEARTDALTGLPNRRDLRDRLGDLLARSVGEDGAVVLLLLDLDRFAGVNDLHGRSAGDGLLQLVSARLRAASREGDLVARLAADEFAFVVPFEAAGNDRTGAMSASVAKRVAAAMDQPFTLQTGLQVTIGVTMGVAITSTGEADELLSQADLALQRAKADGHCRFLLFDPEMNAAARRRASLEADLRQAVADGTIVPHVQPLVDLASRRIVAFETLARWTHPARGAVPPAEFIPVVEEIGLIDAMSEALLRRACCVAATWPPDILLAFNVSPLQLRDRSLPAIVASVLADTGFPPDRLELEITESALVGDFELARAILYDLKSLGTRLALDDFGTGYSTLRHLQKLPFDTIKIDASFVGLMLGDAESRKIVTAVIGLGRSLGMTVVAEGIEEPETASLLESMNCDIGQGWLFGRPGPMESAVLEPFAQRPKPTAPGPVGPRPQSFMAREQTPHSREIVAS